MIEPSKKKSRFLKIACPRCGFYRIVYGKSSIKIKCEKCNKLLIKTNGGKIKVKAPIKQVM
jgi:ribosomal protein S27E